MPTCSGGDWSCEACDAVPYLRSESSRLLVLTPLLAMVKNICPVDWKLADCSVNWILLCTVFIGVY